MVDQYPRRDTLPVLGDSNTSIGTDRDGYETCVGSQGSGTVNQNSTKVLDFARSHGFTVAGSWFHHPQTGGVAKEIDHALVDGRWRMIQNCRVFQSAQFNTDHRLVVATLKLQLKSKRKVPSQPNAGCRQAQG